jgi:hypothetical protein
VSASATSKGTVPARLPRAHISGIYQTSPGLLRRHLIGPWGEGLAQYLILQVGDVERGKGAHRGLLRMLGSIPPEELVQTPGPKARIYRLARQIAAAEREIPGKKIDPKRLPWRRASGYRGAAIERLRKELTANEAELLELHCARELDVAEIACVLEAEVDVVELALDTAHARARFILEEYAPDPVEESAEILVEAFALEEQNAYIEDLDDDDPGLEAGTILGGRYRLVERVGIGAFGDVYRAEDTEVPGHRVALKLLRQPSLSETARHTALRELRLNAAAFHPSLVQFKDHGWFEQRLWFVMPWYEGETLEQRMEREPLTRDEARTIFEPLARALAALHAAGIRHQDIKPDNILLTKLPGEGLLPVLIDLGVAADSQEQLLGGTPLYFAPEVAARFAGADEDDYEIGPAADVFALALSLRNALEPESQEDVPAGAIRAFVSKRATGDLALPEQRPLRFLRGDFKRWLSNDPNERPSAARFAEELAVLTAPEEKRARRLSIARWLAPLLVALGTVFVAVVYFLHQSVAQQAQQARQARDEAADVREDLVAVDARRRALEEGRRELQNRFEQSNLSRSQLAARLATSEREVQILSGDVRGATAERDEARAIIGERERTIAARDAQLATARQNVEARTAELAGARRDIDTRTAELEAARAEVRRRELELAEARDAVRAAHEETATERAARREAEDRAIQLSEQLAAALRAQRAAERALEEREQTPQPEQPAAEAAPES